jgi:hypothetical protein
MQENSTIRKDYCKKLLQKNSKKQSLEKMSTGREQQIKTEYTENKILFFFE